MCKCEVKTLKELNPKYKYYTDDDPIPALTVVEVPQLPEVPQAPQELQNTTNESNTNYTSGSIVEIEQNPVQEEEEGSWWDWVGEIIVAAVVVAIEIIKEVAIELTPIKYVVAAYKVIKAVSEGNYRDAFSAAAEFLPLARQLKKAAKVITVVEKAEKLNRAAKDIEDAYHLIEAVAKDDWGTVGRIVQEKAIEKGTEKAVEKINKHAKEWKDKSLPIPEKPTKITVYARADAFKAKHNITEEDIKLAIPSDKTLIPNDEREKVLVEVNNKQNIVKETPKEKTPKTTDDKPKNDKSKDDEEKELQTPTLLYANRILKIKEDVKYLSPDDKTRFEKIASEKHIVTAEKEAEIKQFEGKINSKKKQLLKIEENIKGIADEKDREVFKNRLKNIKTPQDIDALVLAHAKYEKLSSTKALVLTLEEKEGKIKIPTALEQRQNLVAALEANKQISPADFEPITQKEKDNKVAEYRAYQKELEFRNDTTNKKAIPWANTNYENTGIKDKNLLKHTPAQKEIAAQKVQNFFDQKKAQDSKWTKAKNIGYLDGELKYQNKPLILDKSIQTSVSQNDLDNNPELQKLFKANIFDAKQVSSDGYSRPLERIDLNDPDSPFLPIVTNYRDARHDSEYLMLTRLALDIREQTRLDIKKGGVYKDIKGHITIVSSNDICPSCQNVVLQFNQMFPEITLTIIDKIIPVDTNKNLKK